MGVSLGATRVLRMTRRTTGKDESKELEPVLEPGHPASDWIGLESMSDRARAGTTAASPDSGRLQSFEVLLVPGSVYIQRYGRYPCIFYDSASAKLMPVHHLDRDAIRYEFDHAIPAEDTFQGQHIPPGQRLSIMIRVRAFFRLHRPSTLIEIVSFPSCTGQEGHSFLAEAGHVLSSYSS